MSRPRLYLNRDADYDWLIALEFGRVDDGQPPENRRGVTDEFGWYHDGAEGPCIGFSIVSFSEFDPEADEVAEIWNGARFDAPQLGLSDANAGEIVVAARAFFADGSSFNRQCFDVATSLSGEEALVWWRRCLESGDSMAHFGLGYTLYELGRFQEAYRHLRHYTEIAPHHPWNWVWFAKAAAAIGERTEAVAACERAIELTADGCEETDAPELLASL